MKKKDTFIRNSAVSVEASLRFFRMSGNKSRGVKYKHNEMHAAVLMIQTKSEDPMRGLITSAANLSPSQTNNN